MNTDGDLGKLLSFTSDITNYYIYSYNGTDAISSDMNFWHYADCLYEYEGNGIIVHDGGSGRDRVEYASLYSMVNNKIVREKETMSTAANSAEELYAFLDSLTPINDFHPITDYSYLSNWSNQ